MFQIQSKQNVRRYVTLFLYLILAILVKIILLILYLNHEGSLQHRITLWVIGIISIELGVLFIIAYKGKKRMHYADLRFDSLKNLIENVNRGGSFIETMNYIYSNFRKFIPYEYIGISILKDNGQTLEAKYGISDKKVGDLVRQLDGIEAPVFNTSLGDVIKKGVPRVINDLSDYVYTNNRQHSFYNQKILKAGIQSSITLPLIVDDEPIGVIFFSSTVKNAYNDDHLQFLEVLSNSLAISFKNSMMNDELLYSSVIALTKLAEARDHETGHHINRIQHYSKAIAQYLEEDGFYLDQMGVNFETDIFRFSPMHDIGKVGIPDHILLKPEKLTEDEWIVMKQHPIYGAEVLRVAEDNLNRKGKSLFKLGIEIAENHHEKWNGKGYPYQKSKEEIPLCARIIAVADVFDALTSNRPYKTAFSFEESFDMIVSERGQHFDPSIIDCLLNHKDEFYQLYVKMREDRKSLTENN